MRRAVAGLLTIGVGVVLWRLLRDDGGSPDAPPSAPRPSGGASPVPPAAVAESGSAPARADTRAPEPSRKELYARAQELGVEGRSKMSKEALRRAVDAAST